MPLLTSPRGAETQVGRRPVLCECHFRFAFGNHIVLDAECTGVDETTIEDNDEDQQDPVNALNAVHTGRNSSCDEECRAGDEHRQREREPARSEIECVMNRVNDYDFSGYARPSVMSAPGLNGSSIRGTSTIPLCG
jgi:hypothetical protein